MAFELGVVAGLTTHFHLYTVPGQPEPRLAPGRAARRGRGSSFVVDSDARLLEETAHALADVDAALAALGPEQAAIPRVYQFNKRDLPTPSRCTRCARGSGAGAARVRGPGAEGRGVRRRCGRRAR